MPNQTPSPRLSLVIPVFNEEDNLRELQSQIARALDPTGQAYEVLYVDDASRDSSLAVLRELADADPRVRYISFAQNRGQSAGFAAGFQEARGELIVTLDADLQNDPADIPKLLAAMESQGLDMICGLRAKRQDSFAKRYASKVGNRVRTWLSGKTVTDTGCSLKIMRADMARRLPMFTGMHRFLPNLMVLEGARIGEMPVNHRPRVHGVSKYGTLDRALAGGYDLLAMRWIRTRYINYQIKDRR